MNTEDKKQTRVYTKEEEMLAKAISILISELREQVLKNNNRVVGNSFDLFDDHIVAHILGEQFNRLTAELMVITTRDEILDWMALNLLRSILLMYCFGESIGKIRSAIPSDVTKN